MSVVQETVDAVQAAFREEAGSLSGKELCEREVDTNHVLRTAWPVVRHALINAGPDS